MKGLNNQIFDLPINTSLHVGRSPEIGDHFYLDNVGFQIISILENASKFKIRFMNKDFYWKDDWSNKTWVLDE